MRALAVLMMLCAAASAQECPPDKPLAKMVVDYSKPVTCTAMLCAPRLTCDFLSGKCALAAVECNTCTVQEVRICISQEEFERAAGIPPGTELR